MKWRVIKDCGCWWVLKSNTYPYEYLLPKGLFIGNISIIDIPDNLAKNPKVYFNSRRWAIQALGQYDKAYEIVK